MFLDLNNSAAVSYKKNYILKIIFEKKYFDFCCFSLDVRLIRWQVSYSGWLYALLEMNKIIESPMTYTSGSGESGLLIAKRYISLVIAVLNVNIGKVADFEPLIGTVIVLIKR